MYGFQRHRQQWPTEEILPGRFEKVDLPLQQIDHQFVVRGNVEAVHVGELDTCVRNEEVIKLCEQNI